jgi:hypothetical protein
MIGETSAGPHRPAAIAQPTSASGDAGRCPAGRLTRRPAGPPARSPGPAPGIGAGRAALARTASLHPGTVWPTRCGTTRRTCCRQPVRAALSHFLAANSSPPGPGPAVPEGLKAFVWLLVHNRTFADFTIAVVASVGVLYVPSGRLPERPSRRPRRPPGRPGPRRRWPRWVRPGPPRWRRRVVAAAARRPARIRSTGYSHEAASQVILTNAHESALTDGQCGQPGRAWIEVCLAASARHGRAGGGPVRGVDRLCHRTVDALRRPRKSTRPMGRGPTALKEAVIRRRNGGSAARRCARPASPPTNLDLPKGKAP